MANPLRDLHCTCYKLRKAARSVTALFDDALAPAGLTSTQFSILAMAADGTARPVSELAQALGMDISTLSRTLRPLESAGYLRVASGVDRRAKPMALTPSGRDLLAAALPLWRSAQKQVERMFGSELGVLHTLLGRVADRRPGKSPLEDATTARRI